MERTTSVAGRDEEISIASRVWASEEAAFFASDGSLKVGRRIPWRDELP